MIDLKDLKVAAVENNLIPVYNEVYREYDYKGKKLYLLKKECNHGKIEWTDKEIVCCCEKHWQEFLDRNR